MDFKSDAKVMCVLGENSDGHSQQSNAFCLLVCQVEKTESNSLSAGFAIFLIRVDVFFATWNLAKLLRLPEEGLPLAVARGKGLPLICSRGL